MTSNIDDNRTIKHVLDDFSSSEKDLLLVILGAIEEGITLPPKSIFASEYDGMSKDKKIVIDYVVGTSSISDVEHSNFEVDNFLAHHGVKGMRWGVRKNPEFSEPRLSKSASNSEFSRKQARSKVKAGTASLEDAHVAALKSTGHRVLNAFVGDKTFWRREAKIVGLAVGIGVAATAGAVGLPMSTIQAIGYAGGISSSDPAFAYQIGQMFVVAAGAVAAKSTIAYGTAGNAISNVSRSVLGNRRIDKSYATLGKRAIKRQKDGGDKVVKVLNSNGSISKKHLDSQKKNPADKKTSTVKHSSAQAFASRLSDTTLADIRRNYD